MCARDPQDAARPQSQAHASPRSLDSLRLAWRLAEAAGGDAELGDEARELEQRVEAVEDAHVAEADLLDELELEALVHRLELDDAEEGTHYVEPAVASLPERLDDSVGLLEVSRD